MSSSLVNIPDEQLLSNDLQDLSIKDLSENMSEVENHSDGFGEHGGICAICLDNIALQETALVKGCEHAYCVTCILHWVTYDKKVTCPQCKHPFEFLAVHRTLDGSIQDYMFDESVCLLLRAKWFKPLIVEDHVVQENIYEEVEEFYLQDEYEEADDDLDDDVYYGSSSSVRIGNRRWGDNGFVRAGRQEARPVNRLDAGASSSRESKKKENEASKSLTGRRAKRALKREAADKAAEAKHQQHLLRLGRK